MEEMEQFTLPSAFGFSALPATSLGATEYTVATVAVDVSGSTSGFQRDMESALGGIVEALRKSPRADNLLLRVVRFSDRVEEVHGFKTLDQCNPGDYAGTLRPQGMTALYDAAVSSVQAIQRYGEDLYAQDMSVNSILIVLTDGCDNVSHLSMGEYDKAVKAMQQAEKVESLVSILVGVNVQDATVSRTLNSVAPHFSQYVELKDAKPGTIAKLIGFVSQNISSQSQSLGTGGPSKVLSF